ncbi:hypothetical protein [Parageobacillus thermoglucosidasius]|uniref:Uncharacterized protein n=1 Tax=Parageobacillus thermoglucosidasius TaxID=1426 RepID=A0AB38R3J3_PARTM|nr:hypothetical protein [Parageobacillus thermoglucosidasius]UOE78289.1 hypothetical protein IMI45_19875 [Parageobacillus thermoglucosidasius]BDG34090.1 hypothetical protein PthBH41_38020 [Parageobacillus thermoglucosidasius]GMO01720.1 hypothetical protein PthstB1num2_37610 [Parageobacillus thermoglucosidasius]
MLKDLILNLFFRLKGKNDVRKLEKYLDELKNNEKEMEPVGIIVNRWSGKLKKKYHI